MMRPGRKRIPPAKMLGDRFGLVIGDHIVMERRPDYGTCQIVAGVGHGEQIDPSRYPGMRPYTKAANESRFIIRTESGRHLIVRPRGLHLLQPKFVPSDG